MGSSFKSCTFARIMKRKELLIHKYLSHKLALGGKLKNRTKLKGIKQGLRPALTRSHASRVQCHKNKEEQKPLIH